MTTDRERTRIIRSWLRTDEHESADRVLDAVLDALDETPQRRALPWPLRGRPEMHPSVGLAIGVAAAVLIALVGIQLLVPGGPRIGVPAEAAPEPTPVPRRLSSDMAPLEPGRYTVGPEFPVQLTFEVPDGFDACAIDPLEQGICARTATEAGLTFVIVDNLVDDPCSVAPGTAEPPIGPTVDDLIQGLSNLPGLSATPVQPGAVDGRPAQTLTLAAVFASACERRSFSGETWIVSPARTNGVGDGERNELFILDVQGERLMIAIAYQPGTPNWAVDAMREIVATVRFDG
jgi:hypothetical protein